MEPLGQRNIDNCCGSASVQKIISLNLCIIKPTQVSNEETKIYLTTIIFWQSNFFLIFCLSPSQETTGHWSLQ